MQIIPKLSRERLAALSPGTPLRIGRQLVTFNECRADAVFYTDQAGTPRQFAEAIICASATEHVESQMCDYCGKFRLPADLQLITVEQYRGSKTHTVCREGLCAYMLQMQKRTKPAPTMRGTRGKTSWK
ncbi:hypothetical protein [Hafnia psychrotolerans]|uniref:Uncharacterized protein n=1 Tax=Hafnia psychrotolerans TaxID=1477018 RepID=A0ABQ1FY50_9GAMM|nr:hypothetical protein [Hafnia psychrotolerans]GGA33732.1 hypothetical protein GCM10011328_05710 [Hafnia psychrotolerans]